MKRESVISKIEQKSQRFTHVKILCLLPIPVFNLFIERFEINPFLSFQGISQPCAYTSYSCHVNVQNKLSDLHRNFLWNANESLS